MTTDFGPKGWTPDRIGSLNGKTFVITGATSGTGFEAARLLLSKGAAVIMMNRNDRKSSETVKVLRADFGEGALVSFVTMDLASLSSVREAAAALLLRAPRIDALICNAAIAQVPKHQTTTDGFESQLGVNHYGHFLLCGLVFDRIVQSAGRIVMVGSNGYKMGLKRIKFEDLNYKDSYSAWGAYAQSKLAQMMFGYDLSRKVRAAGLPVEVHVCHPGASRTSLIDTSGSFGMRMMWKVMSLLAQSAEKGAWPQVMCATEDGLAPEAYYGPTKYEMVGPVGSTTLAPFALDQEQAERLWAVSEENTGLSWTV